MRGGSREVRVLSTALAVAEEAAAEVARCGAEAVGVSGRFCMAVSGGTTPRLLFELLAGPLGSSVPWEQTRLLWCDERCVPPDHPDSNYRLAAGTLLAGIAIPPSSVHRMRGEDPPDSAAAAYEALLPAVLAPTGRLDLAILGMGADGHTASLFAGTGATDQTERSVVANYVPSLESWRLTMTYRLLNAARNVVFLVTGTEKVETLRRALAGDPMLPVTGIRPNGGRVLWLVDRAAGASVATNGGSA